MPKSSKKKKFNYNCNRKKLKKQLLKKTAPRIECGHIRNAWNDRKSAARNLQEMGLAFDPNKVLPIHKDTISGGVKQRPTLTVKKPYVVSGLEAEASLPREDANTLSNDLIEYVHHMVREHGDNYKAMARDEKNYYQDTPKQIKRKIDQYRRFYPQEHAQFMASLTTEKTESN